MAFRPVRCAWMRQARFARQSNAFNQFVRDSKIDPCLGETYSWDEIGLCHQLMFEGKQPLGVMAALVNAPRTGLKDCPDNVVLTKEGPVTPTHPSVPTPSRPTASAPHDERAGPLSAPPEAIR